MSRSRHKMRASGGKLSSKPVWNAGGEQNAAKEAEELRHGGKAEQMHVEGEGAKKRADRRARGGKVEHEHMKPHHRAKGGRLRGEGVGADKTPLTTASKIKLVTKGEIGEDAEKSD